MTRASTHSLFITALLLAAPIAAQTRGPEAIDTKHAINDADPESSVPSAAEAIKDPLEMGYLMMALSDRGEAALKAGNPSAAAKYFRAIGKAVPERAVAFRKACRAHDAAGERDKAIEMCRAALGKGGVTAQDHVQLVQMVLKKGGVPTAAEATDADAVLARLAGELGWNKDPERTLSLAELRCQLATRLEDRARLKACVGELDALGAREPRRLAYALALAIAERDASAAQAVVERAKRAKLPIAAQSAMQKSLLRSGLKAPEHATDRSWALGVAVLLGLAVLSLLLLTVRRRARLAPA
jgi:hypothetical protein